MGRVVLITACGGKKEKEPRKAGELYKSARIRHLYRRSRELNVPFMILSAGYGLVDSEELISPYEAVMSRERCSQLKDKIRKKLKGFSKVVYFRGGARKEYLECLEEVVRELGLELYTFGYGNMGDIGKLEEVLKKAYGEDK